MTAPAVQGTPAQFQAATAAGPFSVTLPTGITSGELLVMVIATDGNPTVTQPTGWTLLDHTVNGAACSLTICYRVADGTEGSTASVAVSASESIAVNTYRVSGHDSATNPPEVATANNSTGSPDAPNLAPTGGAADYLFLAGFAQDVGYTPSATPTGYTCIDTEVSSGGGRCGVGSGYKATTGATSENPGAWTTSSDNWVAATVAVYPAAAGNVTGTIAVTEAADTSAASGSQTNSGTLANSEAADTSSAAGTQTNSGTIAVTEQADTSAASGAQTNSGSIAVTEAADTSDATGGQTNTATLANLETADSSSATATQTNSGTIAAVEAADTSAASGTVGGGTGVTGTIAVTEAADTSAAAGTQTNTATAAQVETGDTSNIVAFQTNHGTAAQTEAADTSAMSGTVGTLFTGQVETGGDVSPMEAGRGHAATVEHGRGTATFVEVA